MSYGADIAPPRPAPPGCGQTRLRIEYLQKDSNEERELNEKLNAFSASQGLPQPARTAKSIRQWRSELGVGADHLAQIQSVDGSKTYKFTLEPWKNCDQDRILLRIQVVNYGLTHFPNPPIESYDLTEYP